ncbi:MAG: RDD family protein, partial [Acidimicrobiia bacterium]|nr:RDD family protein [Acidimicrobiia bacterium]
PAPAPPAPDAPALDLVGEAEEPAVVAPMPDGAVMASPGPSGGLAGRRAAAAVLDHGLLLAIDLVVVYFTLRIAGIEVDQARALPVVPLVTFLVLVKLAYFAVFTACGGQTIGKMAQGIQVVTTDLRSPEMSLGVMRSTAAVASVLSLGLAYLPALVAGDGRAVHDRLAGTRVVSVRP